MYDTKRPRRRCSSAVAAKDVDEGHLYATADDIWEWVWMLTCRVVRGSRKRHMGESFQVKRQQCRSGEATNGPIMDIPNPAKGVASGVMELCITSFRKKKLTPEYRHLWEQIRRRDEKRREAEILKYKSEEVDSGCDQFIP